MLLLLISKGGRGGYGHVNSDLDEVVQYLLHNTSNSYHIPLNKTGSNDKVEFLFEGSLIDSSLRP